MPAAWKKPMYSFEQMLARVTKAAPFIASVTADVRMTDVVVLYELLSDPGVYGTAQNVHGIDSVERLSAYVGIRKNVARYAIVNRVTGAVYERGDRRVHDRGRQLPMPARKPKPGGRRPISSGHRKAWDR